MRSVFARVAAAAFASLALSAVAASATGERDALAARWIAEAKPSPAIRAQLEGPHPAASAPGDLARLAADELNAPGRYQLSEKVEAPRKSWLEAAWDWVKQRLSDLWDRLRSRLQVGRTGAMAFGDVLIAVAALALIAGLWFLLINVQIERRKRTPSTPLDDIPDARRAYARALAAARNGDFAGASRLLFVATVLALDLRGAVASDPSATVGDLRRLLRARDGALVVPFDTVAMPFVRSAYAELPVAGDDWERARTAFLSILPEEAA